MLKNIADATYNAYLAALRPGASRRRRKLIRKFRKLIFKFGDPDVTARLDGFQFRTPLSSDILLCHFEFPFYDSVLPRLAEMVASARGGLTMVDVGANVGVAVYLVSRKTSGKFLCLEANARFRECLSLNLAQIPGSAFRIVALSDQPGRQAVRHCYSGGNSNLEVNSGGEMLEFVTLDEAVAGSLECRAPNLVKIDTEGFELKVLRGACRTLAEHRPVLFLEFFPDLMRREATEPDEIFALLREAGYDQFVFYDGGGNLLIRLGTGQTEELRTLRRFCELRHWFFDVAAFHSADSRLAQDFVTAEAAFFDGFLRGNSKAPA
jgi:FkbM family methyltransferase